MIIAIFSTSSYEWFTILATNKNFLENNKYTGSWFSCGSAKFSCATICRTGDTEANLPSWDSFVFFWNNLAYLEVLLA